MGYTTTFEGRFNITPTLTEEHRKFLTKFSETRRMARKVGPEYGVEGEWYVDGAGWAGQDHDKTIIDYNNPPSTQPGLWCQWIPTEDGDALVWDEGEKFYYYVEWLEYLVENYLKPRGYTISGEVEWQGEDSNDRGLIRVNDNNIKVGKVKISYEFED